MGTMFHLSSVVNFLTSSTPEKYSNQRAIELFQFRTWIYFPDDNAMIDAAGKLAAAAFLRKLERVAAKTNPEIGGQGLLDAKQLINLLRTPEYSRVYNAHFMNGGWSSLLRAISPTQFNKIIAERNKTAETVCEMVDFRFRALDHKSLTSKQANISRSEFFLWFRHPKKVSGRTIRSRWKENRTSAPFLYVCEKFAPKFRAQSFDTSNPTKGLINRLVTRAEIARFVGMSLYVAEVIDAALLRDDDEIKTLPLRRYRPETERFLPGELDKMKFYKDEYANMRNR